MKRKTNIRGGNIEEDSSKERLKNRWMDHLIKYMEKFWVTEKDRRKWRQFMVKHLAGKCVGKWTWVNGRKKELILPFRLRHEISSAILINMPTYKRTWIRLLISCEHLPVALDIDVRINIVQIQTTYDKLRLKTLRNHLCSNTGNSTSRCSANERLRSDRLVQSQASISCKRRLIGISWRPRGV